MIVNVSAWTQQTAPSSPISTTNILSKQRSAYYLRMRDLKRGSQSAIISRPAPLLVGLDKSVRRPFWPTEQQTGWSLPKQIQRPPWLVLRRIVSWRWEHLPSVGEEAMMDLMEVVEVVTLRLAFSSCAPMKHLTLSSEEQSRQVLLRKKVKWFWVLPPVKITTATAAAMATLVEATQLLEYQMVRALCRFDTLGNLVSSHQWHVPTTVLWWATGARWVSGATSAADSTHQAPVTLIQMGGG